MIRIMRIIATAIIVCLFYCCKQTGAEDSGAESTGVEVQENDTVTADAAIDSTAVESTDMEQVSRFYCTNHNGAHCAKTTGEMERLKKSNNCVFY